MWRVWKIPYTYCLLPKTPLTLSQIRPPSSSRETTSVGLLEEGLQANISWRLDGVGGKEPFLQIRTFEMRKHHRNPFGIPSDVPIIVRGK